MGDQIKRKINKISKRAEPEGSAFGIGGKMKETYIQDMEFLIRELHKEWGRSRPERKCVAVSLNEAEVLKKKIATTITKQQKIINSDNDIEFKQSIKMSKDNFVMLRIAKKLSKKMKKGGNVFILDLDNEEYRKYVSLMKPEEGDKDGKEI